MKETGILFTPDNHRLIMDDLKTQTRRVCEWEARPESLGINFSASSLVSGLYHGSLESSGWVLRSRGGLGGCWNDRTKPNHCLYGVKGDRLYVKEGVIIHGDGRTLAGYYLDGARVTNLGEKRLTAMFMAKWAARTWLEITEVRVERLQDISEEDAKAEGAEFFDGRPVNHHGWRHSPSQGFVWDTAKQSYQHLWDQINRKKHPWSSNPWVWVLTFRRVTP